MSDLTARTIFSILCLLALIAVAGGGVLEVLRQKRGESLLRPGHFRLRMFSVFVWIILLGSLSFAVAFLWPQPNDKESARNFLAVVSGSLSLLFIALLLLAYDVWQIGRQRRESTRKFEQQLEGMARAEIEKVKLKNSSARDNGAPDESGQS